MKAAGVPTIKIGDVNIGSFLRINKCIVGFTMELPGPHRYTVYVIKYSILWKMTDLHHHKILWITVCKQTLKKKMSAVKSVSFYEKDWIFKTIEFSL